MCWIGFKSGEQASQCITAMSSSYRNCWHASVIWGLALWCIRRNPGPTAPTYGLGNVSEDLILIPYGIQGTSGCCTATKRNASPHHDWPTTKLVMLEYVAFWCSLANGNHPARYWAVSTGPTCACAYRQRAHIGWYEGLICWAPITPQRDCFWQFGSEL